MPRWSCGLRLPRATAASAHRPPGGMAWVIYLKARLPALPMPDIGGAYRRWKCCAPKRISGLHAQARQRPVGELSATAQPRLPFAAWLAIPVIIAPEALHCGEAMIGRFIVADPEVCHGRPTFRGTRILVADVTEQVRGGPGRPSSRIGAAMSLPMPSRKRRGWRTRRFAIIRVRDVGVN